MFGVVFLSLDRRSDDSTMHFEFLNVFFLNYYSRNQNETNNDVWDNFIDLNIFHIFQNYLSYS
jgi:hypothetical protein